MRIGSGNLRAHVDAIEKQLHSSKVSPRVLEKLDKKLEAIGKQIHVNTFTQSLKDEIVRLHGEIHTLSVDCEVKKIRDEARGLEKSLGLGDVSKIGRVARSLKKHIAVLLDNHALIKIDIETITAAKISLQKAECFLQGKPYTAENFPGDAMDLEEVTQFFELAELFYKHKATKETGKFKELYATYGSLRENMDMLGKEHDDLKTAQALFATATGSSYPTQDELRKFFASVDHIKKDDNPTVVSGKFR